MRAFVIDAFTDTAFHGNPAGVVLLDEPADTGWMQDVAAELKHSETAFVLRRPGGDHDLRWFTPLVEVDLCGHATLASTHALHSVGAAGPFTFHTRSGVLRTTVGADGSIVMDFPVKAVDPSSAPAGLIAALGVDAVSVHSARTGDVLVEVADESTVRLLRPDIRRLADIDCRGVIVTAPADAGTDADFVSRFFAPRMGVDEDPVTGSAHCALAPFWADRLGRSALRGLQVSPRGGRLDVEVNGDRVMLRGQARTVLDGTLRA